MSTTTQVNVYEKFDKLLQTKLKRHLRRGTIDTNSCSAEALADIYSALSRLHYEVRTDGVYKSVELGYVVFLLANYANKAGILLTEAILDADESYESTFISSKMGKDEDLHMRIISGFTVVIAE